MYSYTVSMAASKKAFDKACRLIEKNIEGIEKDKILEDVDGSAIQKYSKGDDIIRVYNDYEVDAVYIDSDIDLDDIF